MFKTIIATSLLALFCSPLFAQSIPTHPQTEKAPKEIFRFKAPKEWKLVAGKKKGGWYYTPQGISKPKYAWPLMYGGESNDGHSCNIAIYKMGAAKERLEMNQLSRLLFTFCFFGGISPDSLKKVKPTISFSGAKIAAYEMDPKVGVGVYAYFIFYDDSTWLLTYGGNADIFKKHKTNALKALATFKPHSQMWFPRFGF